MLRIVDHLLHRADLDDPAGVHHGDAVGGLGDHAHVVGDQHHRGAVVAAEALQELDDLRLDRDVERGGGLVGDDEARVGAEGEGDHHALAHPAGELVRVVVDAPLGRRDADLPQQLDGTGARLGRVHRQVLFDRLGDLAPDGVERIQRRERVLEDRPDAPAADLAHLLAGEIVDAGAFQQDLAPGDSPGALEQADDRGAGDRLARARFAHHPQHLARRDVEAHVIDGDQGSAPGVELDAEVFDLEEGRWAHCAPATLNFERHSPIASSLRTTGAHSWVVRESSFAATL